MRRRILVAVLVLVLAIIGTAAYLLGASVARPGGSHEVDGLGTALEIRFDGHLRPFVNAAGLPDAMFAEGWLHARYRLWQMELLRRAGNGRLAEGLGPGLLDSDVGLWRAGVPQLAVRLEASASTGLLQLVDAYVAGVNAGASSLRVRPPELLLTGIEPSPWTRRDVFAVGAIIAFQSANNMSRELLRLSLADALDEDRFGVFVTAERADPTFPYILGSAGVDALNRLMDSIDAYRTPVFPNAAFGSSGWAVAPARSDDGRALFAFDSHDALNLPNLFYEVHLFYGPGQSIRGWSLPGLPGVINGFNEHLAWGLTNIGDTQDLYLEVRHPDDPRRFSRDGEWIEAGVETVSIPVKGRDGPEVVEILTTANGPLISDDPPISLRWTGHDLRGRGLDALLAMNTATDWTSFEAALDLHAAPTANVTYADTHGRIAFRTIGLIPVRRNGDGQRPLPGEDSANDWLGYVDDADLPRLVDPVAGYVAAANAQVHDGLPLVSADNAPGYRMRRLRSVLGGDSALSLRDMQALQLDTRNAQAELLLPVLLSELRAGPEPATRAALAALRAWAAEPVNDADSGGALVWEHWYPELARTVFAAGLEPALLERLLRQGYLVNHALDRLILRDVASPWWQQRRGVLLSESFRRAADTIAENFGDDPSGWRWDAAHSVSFRHELHGAVPILDRWLSRGPYPWGGGHPVLARARYGYDRPFEGRMGATVRVVAEMTDPPTVRAVIPGGQHGHPSSTHYDDQLSAWLDGDLMEIAPAGDRGVTTLVPRVMP